MAEGFVHGPEEGQPVWLGGDLFVVKATGADTGGAYSVTEMTVAPKATGPHPHQHSDAEEAFFVMEGEIYLHLGDTTIAAPKGTFAVVNRGTTHTYSNPSDKPARVLVLLSPPGFEQNFAQMGELAPRRELPARNGNETSR